MRTLGTLFLVLSLNLHAIYLAGQSVKSTISGLNGERQKRVSNYLLNEGKVSKVFDGNKLLFDVSPFGRPLFKMSESNRIAAFTLGTTYLKIGGNSLFNLQGKGMHIGVWEADFPNSNHIEFENRVSQKDSPVFTQGNHATHVIGTIAAKGINAEAEGMASGAIVSSYDADNDNSELANEAANGLLVSNHSYGVISGWNDGSWYGDPEISENEDWKFGFYSTDAGIWDQLVFENPQLLICKSAGNDRGDSGPGRSSDGPYDCISDVSNAKNILTVGAVFGLNQPYTNPNQIRVADFSSWGPTDDGRIKPDVVGMGVGVFSTFTQNNTYGTLQGTSMSTPNVSGSLLLLQELHRKLFGDFMSAASLKGLIIHKSHEAGTTDGPDYNHGWGLVNIAGSSLFLKSINDSINYFQERLLQNGGVDFFDFYATKGSKVRATLCWTDPPGKITEPSLDPTDLKLINDLDLIVIDKSNTRYFPWVLNPSNPSLAATKGDNFRDNIEVIDFEVMETGAHKLRIQHKGILFNESQKYTVLVSIEESASSTRRTLTWNGTLADNDVDNVSNWKVKDTGLPAASLPTEYDRILLEPTTGTLVLSGKKMKCNSLFVTGQDSVYFQLSDSLIVREDLVVSGGPLTIKSRGVNFNGNGNPSLLSGNITIHSNVIFSKGKWGIENAILDFDSLVISNSILRIKDSNLVANSIFSDAESRLTISNTSMHTKGSILINDALSKFVDVTLKIDGRNRQSTVSMNNTSLAGFYAGGNVEILTKLTTRRMEIEGVSEFNDSVETDTMIVHPNSRILFNTTAVQVHKFFQAFGNPGMEIDLLGDGASMLSTENLKFCSTYLNIDGVNAAGPATFSVGLNSEISNSVGWVSKECDDVLFADFEVEYPCPGGLSAFSDRSSGDPESWLYSISQPSTVFDNQTSYFSLARGTYIGSLKITKGEESHVHSKEFRIHNDLGSTLKKPVINVKDGEIYTTAFALSYRWLMNGIEIPNEVENKLIPRGNGLYNLIVTDNFCRFISDTLTFEEVVTDIQRTPIEQYNLFPNPVQEEFNILFTSDIVNSTIVDMQGRQQSFVCKRDGEYIQFDVSTMPNGLYFLSFFSNGNLFKYKFVKSR